MRKIVPSDRFRPPHRIFAALSLLAACGGGSSESANPMLNGITEAHNTARAQVMPTAKTSIPPLMWSDTVAQAAQSWAGKCQFQHSSNGYGENIYADTGQGTAATVVADWVSEKSNYNYTSGTCSGVCGHYTQVVWAASVNLGCGMQHCTSNSPFGNGPWNLWVCDYDPPGNNGSKPY